MVALFARHALLQTVPIHMNRSSQNCAFLRGRQYLIIYLHMIALALMRIGQFKPDGLFRLSRGDTKNRTSLFWLCTAPDYLAILEKDIGVSVLVQNSIAVVAVKQILFAGRPPPKRDLLGRIGLL